MSAGTELLLGEEIPGLDRIQLTYLFGWDFSTSRFVSKLPFKVAADAEQLAASLRLAGLPD